MGSVVIIFCVVAGCQISELKQITTETHLLDVLLPPRPLLGGQLILGAHEGPFLTLSVDFDFLLALKLPRLRIVLGLLFLHLCQPLGFCHFCLTSLLLFRGLFGGDLLLFNTNFGKPPAFLDISELLDDARSLSSSLPEPPGTLSLHLTFLFFLVLPLGFIGLLLLPFLPPTSSCGGLRFCPLPVVREFVLVVKPGSLVVLEIIHLLVRLLLLGDLAEVSEFLI
mmetsp:Transcript_6455/g.13405  ORF Transcript_6455/g.13405 Transcript_6455/m.13405 type:complete len:224 (+) Transcript_6455:328-999(+)